MIRHVVVFTWRPEATDEQKQRVSAELAVLPGLIPGLRDYKFGADQGIDAGNGDFAVTADFGDVAGYLVYRDHPAHQKVVTETIRPIVAKRTSVQIEVD
ncbi:MAG TPA: Dabb family protein [Streptosporangiaceae bacterium]|nr:Dabb family protein [Streptosporangiaceae bacterium]